MVNENMISTASIRQSVLPAGIALLKHVYTVITSSLVIRFKPKKKSKETISESKAKDPSDVLILGMFFCNE